MYSTIAIIAIIIISIIVVLLIINKFSPVFDKFIKWNSDFGIHSKQVDLPWRSAYFRPILVQAMRQGKYNFNTIETSQPNEPISQRWSYKAQIYGDIIAKKKYNGIIDQVITDIEKIGADIAQINTDQNIVTFFKNPTYSEYGPKYISIFNRKYNPIINDIYLEQVKNRKYTNAG